MSLAKAMTLRINDLTVVENPYLPFKYGNFNVYFFLDNYIINLSCFYLIFQYYKYDIFTNRHS